MPSGKELAALIVRDVVPNKGRVIEFGGGTGAFTQALLDKGVPPEQLEIIEINPDFADGLRARFPSVTIIEASAAVLDDVVAGAAGSYAFVVSGLPPADPEGRPEQIVEALLIAADNPPLELVETGTQVVGIERRSRRAHHLAVPRGTDLLIDVE